LYIEIQTMKFLILVLALFAVGAFADDDRIPTEEVALENISKVFEGFQRRLRRDEEKLIGKIAINSIDKSCMVQKYKEGNLLKYVGDEYFDEDSLEGDDAMGAFLGIALQCSNKVDVLAKFVFENYMTFHILFKPLIDEPAIENYTSYVWCVNKYAVDNHFMEDTVYDQKVRLAHDDDELCDEFMEVAKAMTAGFKLAFRKEFERTCAIKTLAHAEKVLIRNILLVQFDLTFEQKYEERDRFVKEVHRFIENFLHCAVAPKSKVNRDFLRLTRF
jgi:hypothetical protein